VEDSNALSRPIPSLGYGVDLTFLYLALDRRTLARTLAEREARVRPQCPECGRCARSP
jgi:hypothetical protein